MFMRVYKIDVKNIWILNLKRSTHSHSVWWVAGMGIMWISSVKLWKRL